MTDVTTKYIKDPPYGIVYTRDDFKGGQLVVMSLGISNRIGWAGIVVRSPNLYNEGEIASALRPDGWKLVL